MALTRAHTAIEHHVVTEVKLAVNGAEGVIGAGFAPGLCVVMAHIVGARHPGIGADLYTFLWRVGVALGVAYIRGKAQALAAKIQAQHGHFTLDTLVIPFGITGLLHAIETQAKCVVLTKAPSHIHRATGLAAGGPGTGQRGDVLVGGALGHYVDPAADAAARRDAVEQLARAFEDIDALGHFHVDGVSRQHAIEAVVGHIAVEQAEPANGELLVAPARRVGGAHRRVAGNQLAEGARLLVLHRLGGIGGHAERRFHKVTRAEQTLRSAARHLAAGIGIPIGLPRHTEDRRGCQLQAAALRHRHQPVRLLAQRLQLQARSPQQLRKALLHRVFTRQAGAAATADQRRVHRQVDPGEPGKTGQRGAQATGRHLIAAALSAIFGIADRDK